VPRFLFFPVSIPSLLLLVHHLYPSPFATHPLSYSFCLTTNLTFPLLPFCSPLSSPLLFSVQFSSPRYRRKIREGVKTGENGGRNRTVVGKKMERGRKRLKE
jgi:hypothetical protein